MKKLLLTFSTVFCLAVTAQTFTQANHSPVAAFTYTTFNCDTAFVNLIQPGGSSVVWNFSAIPITTTTNVFSMITNTNLGFSPADINTVASNGNSSFTQTQLTQLNLIALDISVNGTAATFKYTDAAKIMLYPFTYNQTSTDATAGTISQFPFSSFSGSCNLNYDGTGTLVLPARTFSNTSRVQTIQTYTFSAPSFASGNLKSETYDYYALTDSKVPVFSASTFTLNYNQTAGTPTVITNQIQKFATILKNYEIVSVNENNALTIQLNVYPNPTTNFVTFATQNTQVASLQILDVNGKIVETQKFNNFKLGINTTSFAAGIYFYSVLDKDDNTLKTGKFNVQK